MTPITPSRSRMLRIVSGIRLVGMVGSPAVAAPMWDAITGIVLPLSIPSSSGRACATTSWRMWQRSTMTPCSHIAWMAA